MSKKKPRPPAPLAAARAAGPKTRDQAIGPRWLMVGGLVIAAGIVAAFYWYTHRGPAKALAFPGPGRPAVEAKVAFEDFTGSETCAECHAEQYANWKGSTHGQAGGPPTPERVIAPFNGRPMNFRDAVVTPSVSATREYVFTVARKDHPVQV